MAELVREMVPIKVADGTTMDAYVSRAKACGPCPMIIVLQELFGVNLHIRSVADRLAQQGSIAIAPELFHRTAPGFQGDYSDMNSALPHMRALTPEMAEADLRATYDWLVAQDFAGPAGVSCVGFCMGGRIAFLANAVLPLKAAVSFYGGGIAPALLDRAAGLHAPMLFFWGEQDQHIPPEQRAAVIDALKSAGKRYVNVEISDAGHGFFCDERASYNPRAARESWALLLEFLSP
jgi:carboxymethylenebutenolidase